MSVNKEAALSKLLDATVADLTARVKSKEATSGDYKNIIQLLKDNGITCEIKKGSPSTFWESHCPSKSIQTRNTANPMSAFNFLSGIAQFPAWATACIAFTTVAVSEIVWVLCVRWSSSSQTLKAASMASLLVFIGWVGLIVLLGDPIIAIPAEMLGAFAGTCIAIRFDRKQ